MSNVYPAIPYPEASVDSLLETVRALKIAVETLTAQRAGMPAARVFAQGTTPTAVAAGDLWVDTSDNSIVRYWTGSEWAKLTI